MIALIRFLGKNNTMDENYTILLNDLKKTEHDLALAYADFENVVDPD